MQRKTEVCTRISKTLIVLFGTIFFVLLGSIPASAINSSDPNQPINGALTSAFNPKTFSWNIDWPGRISRYDLVYLSPPVDPMQGIPLGNGDVSALVWCESSKIIIVLNKCDLWDDSQTGKPEVWDEKYDFYTTQRQACRIEIDFKYPVFNTLYLTDFKARLSLSDAKLVLDGSTPFGHLAFSAFRYLNLFLNLWTLRLAYPIVTLVLIRFASICSKSSVDSGAHLRA